MYESSPLRKLLHGRAETIRSCTEESLVFSKAFSNEDIPAKKKLAYFQQAIATHGAWLFQNKACVNSMAFGLSTSNVTPGERFHGGFAPVILDGYGVNYVLDKSDLKFSVSEWLSSPVTDAPAFRQTLHRTLEDLHEAGKYAKTHASSFFML
ncbi:hypothetical protein GGI20_005335 [Coemansia sp. BCRC 34301]|nr:hypothetical protein GGI20_005335 [Coemansia sp. BCRC 34301]